MNKTILATILALTIVIFVAVAPAQAEEINPTPGTYSYGSTSEFSPYAELTDGPGPTPTPDNGGLAPTGQNAWLLYVVAIAAITTPLAYFGIKRMKG